MGVVVLVLGPSGSGKSAALRNFDESEIEILNVAGKPLPFRKHLKTANNPSYDNIRATLKANRVKAYAIDDSQYLMAFEAFERAKETGYGKFTDLALNFRNLIDNAIKLTSDDTIIYFLHHTELSDDGKIKAKTLGKMLDNQLTLEGLFSIVLLCQTEGSEHYFITNSDGSNPAKSPMEMFEMKIPNDLKFVDKTIREYYEMTPKKANKEDK